MARKVICPNCREKNYLKNNFCGKCGSKLKNYCLRCHFDQKYHKCGYDKCPSLYVYIKEKIMRENFCD